MQKIVRCLATFFYIGYLPKMPGTYASFIGILIYFFIRNSFSAYLIVCALLAIIGFWTGTRAKKMFGEKDSRLIVIDEVCGMVLCFFLISASFTKLLLGFALFRIFDIIKPFPANIVQRLKGSPGIMGDDIIAALYTNLALRVFMAVFGDF
ncbi:MAG: phosphatidylglycerophosphatase A [Candidatus Omnitrophica bacterium]|nr:phosphatidylglycerophosphatase A [Candidatus Omnitrophota bacterium]